MIQQRVLEKNGRKYKIKELGVSRLNMSTAMKSNFTTSKNIFDDINMSISAPTGGDGLIYERIQDPLRELGKALKGTDEEVTIIINKKKDKKNK